MQRQHAIMISCRPRINAAPRLRATSTAQPYPSHTKVRGVRRVQGALMRQSHQDACGELPARTVLYGLPTRADWRRLTI
jgi:hypothetical protein